MLLFERLPNFVQTQLINADKSNQLHIHLLWFHLNQNPALTKIEKLYLFKQKLQQNKLHETNLIRLSETAPIAYANALAEEHLTNLNTAQKNHVVKFLKTHLPKRLVCKNIVHFPQYALIWLNNKYDSLDVDFDTLINAAYSLAGGNYHQQPDEQAQVEAINASLGAWEQFCNRNDIMLDQNILNSIPLARHMDNSSKDQLHIDELLKTENEIKQELTELIADKYQQAEIKSSDEVKPFNKIAQNNQIIAQIIHEQNKNEKQLNSLH